MSLSGGTSRQTLTQELFVLADEVLQLSFLGGERVKLVDVELAELFNVDRSAVLECAGKVSQSDTGTQTVETHLVGPVVVLRVVLVDLSLLGVLEVPTSRVKRSGSVRES